MQCYSHLNQQVKLRYCSRKFSFAILSLVLLFTIAKFAVLGPSACFAKFYVLVMQFLSYPFEGPRCEVRLVNIGTTHFILNHDVDICQRLKGKSESFTLER